MDPVVAAALVAAAGGVIGAALTLRANRETEAAKTKAVENTNHIDTIRLQMEGWQELAAGYVKEIDRKNAEAIRQTEEADRLRAQLAIERMAHEQCQQALAEERGRNRAAGDSAQGPGEG